MRIILSLLLAFASVACLAVPDPLFPEHKGNFAGIAYTVENSLLPTGAYTDVTTCTSAGLATAISTAAGGTNLVRLNCNVSLSGSVDLTAGVTLFSSNGSTLYSPTTSDNLRLNSNTLVIGIRGEGARPLALATSTGTTNVRVIGNDFYDVSNIAIYGSGTADNSQHTRGNFDRNKFVRCDYAHYFQRSYYSTFNWNDITGSDNRNIQLVGGSFNTIYGNRIDGGITGINMLTQATLGNHSSMTDNLVEYNEVTNITEEGIGGDVAGATATHIGVFDMLVVESTSGTAASNPTIQVNRTGTFEPYNYYAVFMTGAIKGRYATIQATMTTVDADSVSFKLSNNYLTQAQFASIAPGDRVSIGILMARNKFRRNYVVMTTPTTNPEAGTAISIYGNMFDTEVVGNVLGAYSDEIDAVRVTTLCGLVASNKFTNNWETASKFCAPVAGNRIINNTVFRGRLRLRGKTYQTLVNTTLDGQQYENWVYNNIAPDVVNDKWDDTNNDIFTGSTEPSDPAYVGTEFSTSTYASEYAEGDNIRTIRGYRPRKDSIARFVGQQLNIGAMYKDMDNKAFSRPPSIGAFEVGSGDFRSTINVRH